MTGRMRLRALVGASVAAVAVAATPNVRIASAQAEPTYEVRLFARVPDPGAPQGVTLGPDGRVYTVTLNYAGNGRPEQRSKIFGFAATGELVSSYEIKDQDPTKDHGLTKVVFDAERRMYVIDQQGLRLLRVDPVLGTEEVYATFRDIPPCDGSNGPDCSPGVRDLPPVPDFQAFAPDGTLYVTDSLQGVIWRVPRGGGSPSVWFGDIRLTADVGTPLYGPGPIRLMPDRKTLMFETLVQRAGEDENVFGGVLWKLPINRDGSPGALAKFWESRPADGPADMDFGRSGKVYVALAGTTANGTAVLSADGRELRRLPSPVDNARQEVPFDNPLGVALDGAGRLIVANNSFIAHNPSSWALLSVDVGDEAVPAVLPHLGRGRTSGGTAPPSAADGEGTHRSTTRMLPATGGRAQPRTAVLLIGAAVALRQCRRLLIG